MCAQSKEHASTLRAVLGEVSRNPALNDAMQQQLFDQRRVMMRPVLKRAVGRGEIDTAAVTVRTLVDDAIMPSLAVRSGA